MIVACVANYWLFIPSSIIIIALAVFRNFFLHTSRNVQRLEALGMYDCITSSEKLLIHFILSARSPLYSHISATIHGLSSIRAYHEEKNILNKFHYYQNEHTKAWYMKVVTSRWFGIRVDLIGSFFLTMITFSFIALADSKQLSLYCYNS